MDGVALEPIVESNNLTAAMIEAGQDAYAGFFLRSSP